MQFSLILTVFKRKINYTFLSSKILFFKYIKIPKEAITSLNIKSKSAI